MSGFHDFHMIFFHSALLSRAIIVYHCNNELRYLKVCAKIILLLFFCNFAHVLFQNGTRNFLDFGLVVKNRTK